jgi:hypothetical protein
VIFSDNLKELNKELHFSEEKNAKKEKEKGHKNPISVIFYDLFR